MLSGYLDTKGRFYPCPRCGHVSKAAELDVVFYLELKREDKYEFCEDVLLKNGWICIRETDVYKATFDHDGNVLYISEKQNIFFKEHRDKFNQVQIADIEKLLRDFGDLYEWNKKEGGQEEQ